MCLSTVGEIAILVNNAGVMPLGSFLDEPDQITRTTLDINICGLTYRTRLRLPICLPKATATSST